MPTPPSLADDLASLSASYPQLAFPLEMAAPLSSARPDASVLKRRPEGEHWEKCVADGKDHKLWLSFWLVAGHKIG